MYTSFHNNIPRPVYLVLSSSPSQIQELDHTTPKKWHIRYPYFLRIGRQTQPVNVRAGILKSGNYVCHTFFFEPDPAVWKKLLADLKSDFLPKDLGCAQNGPQFRRPGFSCADRHRAGRWNTCMSVGMHNGNADFAKLIKPDTSCCEAISGKNIRKSLSKIPA